MGNLKTLRSETQPSRDQQQEEEGSYYSFAGCPLSCPLGPLVQGDADDFSSASFQTPACKPEASIKERSQKFCADLRLLSYWCPRASLPTYTLLRADRRAQTLYAASSQSPHPQTYRCSSGPKAWGPRHPIPISRTTQPYRPTPKF